MKVMAFLHDTETLKVLSTCSKELRELAIRPLHRVLKFDMLMRDSITASYASYCVSKHAKLRRAIYLTFTPGPIRDDEADTVRASQYGRILKASASSLRSISIDLGGSRLGSIGEVLLAIGQETYSQLTYLELKCYVHRELRTDTAALADLFQMLAVTPHSLPRLRHLSLEGTWQLVSTISGIPAATFDGLVNMLALFQKLSTLRIINLVVSSEDLHAVLRDIPGLSELQLRGLPNFELQHYFASLDQTVPQRTLKNLKLKVECETFWSEEMLHPREEDVQFPALEILKIDLQERQPSEDDPDFGTRTFYTSFLACPWLAFPSLEGLILNSAFDRTQATSLAILEATCSNLRRMAPKVAYLGGNHMKPDQRTSEVAVRLAEIGVYANFHHDCCRLRTAPEPQE